MSDTEQPQARYFFICGSDDFLVDREAKSLYQKYSQGLADEFSKEIIDGTAQNLSKLELILKHFIESIQIPSLFGGNKVVWLRGINFLEDSPLGRCEGAKMHIDHLVTVLEKINPNSFSVILSASPVDKRTRGFKSLKAHSHFQLIEDESDPKALALIVAEECKKYSITITPDAIQALLAKVNNNSRLLMQEIEKLSTYLGKSNNRIDMELITDMVPQFGENDFFEFSEAFFSLDFNWTLSALSRHFFIQKESRSLITSLFNKLHLLIPLRVLLDSGSLDGSSYGINKIALEKLAMEYQLSQVDGQNKSAFNLFTQNPWYLGKLAAIAKKIPLKKLIDFDFALIKVFEDILIYSQPEEQELIMRQFVIQSLK